MDNALKIWIVDDDGINRILSKKTIERALEGLVKIEEFADGQEAIEALSDQKVSLPNVLLLDINMPIVDGWDFLDYLIEHNLTLPSKIVVVSSSIDPRDQAKALSYESVHGYISKPLTETHVSRW